MPASPLTAALMAGGGNENMMAMDPAVMAAQPDIQLGQALMQGGLSTAPASPWQALGRIAQAAAGGYIQRGAISQLAQAYSGSAEAMAKIFDDLKGGESIAQGLRSPDLAVRSQFMQLAPRAMLQLQEMNPEAAAAKTSAVKGAEGPFELHPVMTMGPKGPTPGYASTTDLMGNGAPSAPRPSAPPTPTAAVQQPAPQAPPKPAGGILPFRPGSSPELITGGGAAPSAAMEPPATFDQRFNGRLPLASESEIAGAKTAAEEDAKNKAQYGDLLKPQGPLQPGPGTTEPVKSQSGTMIPALKDQGVLPTNAAQLKEAVPAWQKTVNEWTSSLPSTQQAEQRLTTIANALKQVQSGTWATHKANFAGMLKAAGIDPTKLNLDDPTQVQLVLHENVVGTLDQLKTTNPRFAQSEFKVLSANKEHPDQQPGANLQMLSEDIGTLRQARDLPNDFTAAQNYGWKNPQAFEQAWLKQNPLSGYVTQVKKEIGPLKGMPGFQGAAKSSAASNTGAPQTWTDPVTNKTYKIINGVPHE